MASASGHSPEVIKAAFNDVNCLNKDLVKIIVRLKEKGYKTVLFANADRFFLQKFLQVNIQSIKGKNDRYQTVEDLFDLVRTSSDIRKNKHTPEMIETIAEFLDVSQKHLIIIDDSKKNIESFKQLGVSTLHYQGNNERFLNSLSILLPKRP